MLVNDTEWPGMVAGISQMENVGLTLRCTMIVAGLLACTNVAHGYMVGPPLSLEKLTAEADILFKGTAVSSRPVQDAWFKPCQGFVTQETQFKVIAVIKGDTPGKKLLFRHYDENPLSQGRTFEPQFYHFVPGRTYIVFAKNIEMSGVFRQLTASQTGKNDQGVLLCPNENPVTANTVKEVFWDEFTNTLTSASVSNVIYAIHQLDQMSRESREGRLDVFDST